MTPRLTPRQLELAGEGYVATDARSASIGADCHIDPGYLEAGREQIFRRSWQYLFHEEGLREPGSHVAASVQDRSIVAIRGTDGSGPSEHAVHHFHGIVLGACHRACRRACRRNGAS